MAKQQRWMVAQDTFAAELPSGTPVTVVKGQTFPDGHEVVQLDGGRGHLFLPLEEAAADEPAARATVPPRRVGAGKAVS